VKNPRVDSYIAKTAPFARPILEKIRTLFQRACPDIEETIKWGHVSFEHRGMVGGFAAFKQHATFGFWRQDALPDPKGLFRGRGMMASGRLTDVSQLPADKVLLDYIRAAVKLNENGAPPRKTKPKPPLKVPPYFTAALRKNKKALATFESFAPSCKREYVEWVTEAKRPETRDQRIATSMKWLAEGKKRNWKYAQC
jgi:hypothetical protein